jgi:cullin-associated NEDD8-dissociated protein 1
LMCLLGGPCFFSFLFQDTEFFLRSYASGVPPGLPSALISNIKPYLSISDISLLAAALTTLSLLLELAPGTTYPGVEKEILHEIYTLSRSPLVGGAALDSLLAFYRALVKADGQIATHVVPGLVIAVEKADSKEASPANVAKCVARVVKTDQTVAAGTIKEYSKYIKPSSKAKQSMVVLSLLILGELGRFMYVFHKLFDRMPS